jgi:ABC-2 type transport system ATP-binding protein
MFLRIVTLAEARQPGVAVYLKSFVALVAAAGVVAAGCSSSSHTTAGSTPAAKSSTTGVTKPGDPFTRHVCTPKASAPVVATRVAGSSVDYDIVSFDGTKIRVHWFPRPSASGSKSPTVLKGPGWGSPGDVDTTSNGYGLFGDLSIHTLGLAGYNVLTWDPRGFGKSGGTVEVDSPEFEGRDVERIIDWVAQQPGVQLDGRGDPRLGMVGASYGGGIQLVTAAIDCRVDAIVPQIAWHSLGSSLYEAQTVKIGWGNLLYSVSAGHSVDAHTKSAHDEGNAIGVLSAADVQWFLDRGPGDLVRDITVPTLFEQGTIDTLFPLDEAVANFSILRGRGVPSAMLWMCSGHGVCLTDPGDQKLPGQAAIAWLDRYVKDDTHARVGPTFEYVDQNGVEYTADEFPPRASTPVVANGSGTLTLMTGGGSGPAHATGTVGALGSVALPITPAKASHALNVGIISATATNIVGAPILTLRYSGSSPAGARPTRVFAQLIDNATGVVLGNQITPIDVTLDGREHTSTAALEMVAFTARPGQALTLQIVAATTAYAEPRLGGAIHFSSVRIELPTVTGVGRR